MRREIEELKGESELEIKSDGRGKYIIEGKVVNPYAIENQHVLDKLVDEYVAANVTDMVDDLVKSFHPDWDLFEFDNFEADEDGYCPEVLQWFIVHPFLGEYLRNKGEVVLERLGGWIWGRQGFGQALWMDDPITEFLVDVAWRRGLLTVERGSRHEVQSDN